jgi:hypothetical protein
MNHWGRRARVPGILYIVHKPGGTGRSPTGHGTRLYCIIGTGSLLSMRTGSSITSAATQIGIGDREQTSITLCLANSPMQG